MTIAAVLAILLGGAYVMWPASPAAPSAGPAAVPVVVTQVEQRSVPVAVRALGHARALRSVEIRPEIEGRLSQVLVEQGQEVVRGQLLARLDDRAISAALAQARGQLQMSRSQLAVAELDLQRYQVLVRQQAVAAQTLDQQQALVAQLQATLSAAQAAVLAREVELSHTVLHAPHAGLVGIHHVHEGSMLRSNDATGLFSLVQLDPIAIEIAIPQALLPRLHALRSPQVPALRLQVSSAEGGELLAEGTLELIDNRVHGQSGTLRVRGQVANPQRRLWPDQAVSVRLELETLEDARVIPQQALRQGLESPFVWRLDGNTATVVPVRVRHTDSAWVVVEGVEAGDRLVLDGHSRLRPDSLVEVIDEQRLASLERAP